MLLFLSGNFLLVYFLKDKLKIKKKMPSPNGRFGASGGVARPTLCVEQLLPLSSKPQWNPPPVAKPLGRCTQSLRACVHRVGGFTEMSSPFGTSYISGFAQWHGGGELPSTTQLRKAAHPLAASDDTVNSERVDYLKIKI